MRNEMYKLINKYGLNDIRTINESQRLDEEIVKEQREKWESWKRKQLIN